jgi:L-asparaginase
VSTFPRTLRDVTVLAAGGTISSLQALPGQPGVAPPIDADALIAGLPAGTPTVHARSVRAVNGPQLTNSDALALAAAAVAETQQGRGVVITSGTDTIEEVAVLCDAVAEDGPPIVVTGAIRPADAPGADGPANLYDSVMASASPALDGAGGLVCFAGETTPRARYARSTRRRPMRSPRPAAAR